MKHLYSSLVACLFVTAGYAQTFNYEFSNFTADFEFLTESTLATDEVWDDPQLAIPLGFMFSFEGEINDTIYISEYALGGMLLLNPDTNPIDFLIVYSSDIADAGMGIGVPMSPISYKTEGEAGNQICKIEWKEAGFFNDIADGQVGVNRVSFQLWLYEGSNDFEVHFGPHTIKDFDQVHDGWLTTGLAQDIDMNGDGFAMAHITSGNPAAPTITSTSEEVILISSGLFDNPSNGTVYRFGANFVGLEEALENEIWNVYPNPTTSNITLQTNAIERIQYDIVDLSGRVLTSGQVQMSQQIDVSAFDAGIYFVRLSKGNDIRTLQFVKQ